AQKLPEEKKAELLPRLLPKLQQEIVLIEAEAEEFGMSTPRNEHDDPVILNGFRDGPDKELLSRQIKEWTTTRMSIFNRIRDAQDPTKKNTTWSDAADVVIRGFA